MMLSIIAAMLVLFFTTLLTMAGLGSAFIIIPTFYWLGVPLTEAMAIALLLNALGMSFATVNYMRYKLIDFKAALPIILFAIVFSPLGAYSTRYFKKDLLLAMFVMFLLFAGTMMLFYRPRLMEKRTTFIGETATGVGIGIGAGYLGGLLGVGGGNFIVPSLVGLGFDPKRASATSAFIVVFSSLSGFFGHAAGGAVGWTLLGVSSIAAIAGALLGSWLLHHKMKADNVKKLIGVVLYIVALKMAWGLF